MALNTNIYSSYIIPITVRQIFNCSNLQLLFSSHHPETEQWQVYCSSFVKHGCSPVAFVLIYQYNSIVQDLWGTRLPSSVALLSPSHTVTGSGTSPGSSGTGCWPRSWETDCAPHRADNADRLHTRSVCFLAGMISCERRCQSCVCHGRSPFHWHLSKNAEFI